MRNISKRNSKWLIIWIVVICALLLLWLTFFERIRSTESSQVITTEEEAVGAD